MDKKIAFALVVFLLIALGYYLFAQRNFLFPNPEQPAPRPDRTGNTVSIRGYAFVPATLNVKAGTDVTWTNDDPVTHRVSAAGFHSNDLAPGETFAHAFPLAGTYEYSCSIHPAMQGKIIVK